MAGEYNVILRTPGVFSPGSQLGTRNWYDCPMAKNAAKFAPAFELGCPCCGAVLKVDPVTQAVIAHTAPVKPKTFADLEEAARVMREQDSRKESLFQQSVQAEKNKADLLEKKFQEAMKRAKETPDTPRIRDFDLD